FMDNAYNQRQWAQEEKVLRGKILDRDGETLAYSEYKGEQTQERIYPFTNLYSHVIGYNSRVYGKSGLELSFNKYLSGSSGLAGISLNGERAGDTLYLTLSHKLQLRAKELLGENAGAVVAIEPKTGEVLCLYGYPNFNPSDSYLTENWEKLTTDENAPFLPRATSGLYTPGSVMKVIYTAAAVENGFTGFSYEDKGEIEVDGKTFKNSGGKSHGEVGLEDALKVSSNVAFIALAEKLEEKNMKEYAKKFGFDEEIEFELATETPKFGHDKKMSKTEIASAAIGQGKILTTPLHMALVCASVANNGVSMKPYIVQKAVATNGIVTANGKAEILNRVISPSCASMVTEYMKTVVESGTGTSAKISAVEVAGKTGTAETGEGEKDHSWFIGFAPADNPTIAVAVVLEHGGMGGGASAAPIAREIIKAWLN
ncbi:MAG: penicillin-binding protein 2, partial [Clostridia bacterium]|nr:penicillin-binding protein 2 [Clostridia bacterium]